MFVLMTKIFPEFSKERRKETGSGHTTEEDLAEFLFSKLEFKVYNFLIFAKIAERKVNCQAIKTISTIQKIQPVLFLYLLLTSLSLICTEQIIVIKAGSSLLRRSCRKLPECKFSVKM